MTYKFNGLEYQENITLKDLCEQLNKAEGFKVTAKELNKIVESNKEVLTAQDFLNDISNPSYWKATKPLKESSYYDHAHFKRQEVKRWII